jgi:hypothetical protein
VTGLPALLTDPLAVMVALVPLVAVIAQYGLNFFGAGFFFFAIAEVLQCS